MLDGETRGAIYYMVENGLKYKILQKFSMQWFLYKIRPEEKYDYFSNNNIESLALFWCESKNYWWFEKRRNMIIYIGLTTDNLLRIRYWQSTIEKKWNSPYLIDRYLCNGLSGNRSRPSLMLLLGDGETSLMLVTPVSNTFDDQWNSIEVLGKGRQGSQTGRNQDEININRNKIG